jgi:protein-L-isoaspartate(D-aspartate) O-methyltransferase
MKGFGLADLSEVRKWFADELRYTAPIHSARLVAAFAAVPRENFVGAPPWTLITADGKAVVHDPRALYHDVLVELNAESGINNGMPGLWAGLFDALGLAEGETILHAGAGTGYYSAILAECTGAKGHVLAVEIDPTLAALAAKNLPPWPQIELAQADALQLPIEPVDVIVASAGLSDIPIHWLRSLKENGRLLVPLIVQGEGSGRGVQWRRGGRGAMLLVQSGNGKFAARFLRTVTFISIVGPKNAETHQALAAAFARGTLREVRSLRLDSAVDDTCWLKGEGWWLSTAPP